MRVINYIFGFSFPIAFAISVSLHAQDTRPTVAILDFEAQDISQAEAKTLTERLRTEIGDTDAARLIERKALDKILEEQGLQQTGCTSDECVAEVGQLLGVQFMISGAIGRVGDSYTIDVRMFSVETGVTERTKSVTYIGDIDGLLTEMEILAWEIMDRKAPPRLRLKRKEEIELPTIAVLDFEGRGIPQMEAQTLTDRFSTELGNTGAIRLVERNTMSEILKEQGFQQTECTSDECAVEVGQLLGVEFMISGALGKVGNTYTIDAKMFAVGTGAAEVTKSISYQGEVDGLITEIEILAWNIVKLDPPRTLLEKRLLGTKAFLKKQAAAVVKTRAGALIRSLTFPGWGHLYAEKKGWGYSWAVTELATLGLIFAGYSSYQKAYDDYNRFTELYNKETDTDLIAEYRTKAEKSHSDIEIANDMIKTMTSVAAAVWIGNALHAYLSWPRKEKKKTTALGLRFDRDTKQVLLNWHITLGD